MVLIYIYIYIYMYRGFPMYDGATALQTLSVIFGMLYTLLLTALPVRSARGESERSARAGLPVLRG
jgi:hypothetical protein